MKTESAIEGKELIFVTKIDSLIVFKEMEDDMIRVTIVRKALSLRVGIFSVLTGCVFDRIGKFKISTNEKVLDSSSQIRDKLIDIKRVRIGVPFNVKIRMNFR